MTDNTKKVIAFDLDDVLCVRDSEEGKVEKYRTCRPVPEMIDTCNECYDLGYKIIIYTSRGMTGFEGDLDAIHSNLYELTASQLKQWGVKYHDLVMGKTHYDLLIDDKAVNSATITNATDITNAVNN